MTSVIKTKELRDQYHSFEICQEINGSTFEIDPIRKITKIKWVGLVDKHTASTLLSKGGDSVEFQGYDKLLVDRYELGEFDTEARVWIKDLLKTRAKRLSKNVEKIAIVNAGSTMGSIFSNMLTSAITLVMPGLKLKKFEHRDEALDWLNF